MRTCVGTEGAAPQAYHLPIIPCDHPVIAAKAKTYLNNNLFIVAIIKYITTGTLSMLCYCEQRQTIFFIFMFFLTIYLEG